MSTPSSSLWRNFLSSPMMTLAQIQFSRGWWLLSAITALIMNLIAHYVFQGYLDMAPCEKCVYIRYAMFMIVIAGVIAALNPRLLLLRLTGYLLSLYGAIFGAIWSWQLVDNYRITEKMSQVTDPFAAGLNLEPCSAFPTFHFGLPLDSWFPSWFAPTGSCGSDDWSFLGLNMGSWTLIVFIVYIALILASMLAAWCYRKHTRAH